jgi:histidyl-tRNA synthetase
LEELIKVKDVQDLEKCIDNVPVNIKAELEKLLKSAKEVSYNNLVIAPLYHGSLKYYDDVYYRVIQDNYVICKGGQYSSEGISSLGFAFYTDSLLKILED